MRAGIHTWSQSWWAWSGSATRESGAVSSVPHLAHAKIVNPAPRFRAILPARHRHDQRFSYP